MRNETIIIPALEPSVKIINLVNSLKMYGFYHIIVINDGSNSDYDYIFEILVESGCDVVRHAQNQGKGEAIKTGIKRHLMLYGNIHGIITVDADGQHLASDVAKLSNIMSLYPSDLILGVRNFNQSNVPFKSRYGNKITSMFFKLSTGISCPDTQTGLRGIPVQLIHLALSTDGSRYEYEMRFLEEAVKEANVRYINIETVYEDNNSCSHFRPLRDSLRIYGRPVRYMLSSLSGAVVDISFFYLLTKILVTGSISQIIIATVIARVLSGTVNFTLNKLWCFKSKTSTLHSAVRYFLLFITQMLLSGLLVSFFSMIMTPVRAKIIVDSVLFVISYHIQKKYVFSGKINRYTYSARKEKIRMKKKKPVYAIIFSTMLAGYTVFTLLDAFIIPHNTVKLSEVTTEASEKANTEDTTESDNNADNKISANSSDNKISANSSDNRSSTGGFIIAEDGNSSNNSSSNQKKKRRHKRPGKSSNDITNVEAADNESSTSNSTDQKQDTASNIDTTSIKPADWSYSGDNVDISITKEYVNNTYVYVADIQLKNGESLKSAVANNTLGRNITDKTSNIAAEVNAILAINGDYYGFRDSGYVMRNSYLYRNVSSGNDSEDLVVYEDGTMEIIKEGDITADALKDKGAVQIYSFGPGLVENGTTTVTENEEVGQAMQSNPRTAIGYYSSNHYCFVVSDGRTDESSGLTLYQLAEYMKGLGVESAYNLDGGGSTTMYFNGEVINNPTTNGNKISERSVSDIIYIDK